jgi:hypothetical protein
MSVHSKLQIVQQELNAPKNQYNSFGKYYYRSCEDILEGAKPILNKVKATLTIGDELLQIGDRYYIKATAIFTDSETGESVSNSAYAREEESKKGMDASQVTGSTSSYARKYALNGLFCIDDIKDADTRDNSDNGKPAEQTKPTNKPANKPTGRPNPANASTNVPKESEAGLTDKIDEPKIKTLQNELIRTGVKDSVILNMCKIKNVGDMTNEQFVAVMKKFQSTPDKK